MAYTTKNTLISRRGYSGIGGWIDTVGDTLKGALTFYGNQRAAEGAAGVQPVVVASAPPVAVSSGPSTAMIVGGVAVVGLAAILLLKKKGS